MKNSKSNDRRISEGILLALSSAGAYLFAFYYEKGYASVFNIPVSFIDVSLTSILTLSAVIIGLILLILPFINMFSFFTVGRTNPVLQRAIAPVVLLFIFLFVQIYFFGIAGLKDSYLALIFLGILIFLSLIFPLAVQSGKTYINKLEAQEKTEQQFVDVFSLIRIKFGKEALLVVVVFFLGMYLSSSAGKSEAIKQEEFLVTNTTPELVVLRIYGDNLVCVPFDRSTGEIEESFSVIKNTGEAGLTLRFEKLGQLHLQETTLAAQATPTAVPVETFTSTTMP